MRGSLWQRVSIDWWMSAEWAARDEQPNFDARMDGLMADVWGCSTLATHDIHSLRDIFTSAILSLITAAFHTIYQQFKLTLSLLI